MQGAQQRHHRHNEVRFKESTGRPVAQNTKEDLTKWQKILK